MRLFVLFLLLACSLTLFAQKGKKKVANLRSFDERPLHFGFLIGFNAMDFRAYNSGYTNGDNKTLYGDVQQLKPGLNIGIVASYRLRKDLNLRFLPGISFGQRDISFIEYTNVGTPRETAEVLDPLHIKSTFLEFPLLLKHNAWRMHNAKPYIIGGFNTRYDLAKNKQDRLLLRSLDGYIEAGAGVDLYLTYFRLSIELKTSIGLVDVLNPEGTGESKDEIYNDALDGLKSRLFCLTFYFE